MYCRLPVKEFYRREGVMVRVTRGPDLPPPPPPAATAAAAAGGCFNPLLHNTGHIAPGECGIAR